MFPHLELTPSFPRLSDPSLSSSAVLFPSKTTRAWSSLQQIFTTQSELFVSLFPLDQTLTGFILAVHPDSTLLLRLRGPSPRPQNRLSLSFTSLFRASSVRCKVSDLSWSTTSTWLEGRRDADSTPSSLVRTRPLLRDPTHELPTRPSIRRSDGFMEPRSSSSLQVQRARHLVRRSAPLARLSADLSSLEVPSL